MAVNSSRTLSGRARKTRSTVSSQERRLSASARPARLVAAFRWWASSEISTTGAAASSAGDRPFSRTCHSSAWRAWVVVNSRLMASGSPAEKPETSRTSTRRPSTRSSGAKRYLADRGFRKFSRVFRTMAVRFTKKRKFR